MAGAMHKELVLKGGMAMRAVHGSVRYTKDIDLDAELTFSRERVQGIVRRSIERAIGSGLIAHAQVSEPKQTDTTLRWKISGTQPGSSAPLYLTVEVSRREPIPGAQAIEVPFGPRFAGAPAGKVRVLDSQAIAVTKVLALTDPNRTAARDIFDLAVLIEARVEDPAQLLASLPDARMRLPQAMAELWPKIEAMDYSQFINDVIPYLPPDVAAAITADAFEDMRLTVGTNVEEWLEKAIAVPPASPLD